jgi:hypothetical protein
MFVEENRQRVHMYEAKLVRIWDKIRQLEVTKMRLNNISAHYIKKYSKNALNFPPQEVPKEIF